MSCVPSEDLINSLINFLSRKTFSRSRKNFDAYVFSTRKKLKGLFRFEWILRLACQVFKQMINSSCLFLTSSTVPEYNWGVFFLLYPPVF